MRNFEAYIDESGNTGIDLFKDNNQPFFWTGTIIVEEGSKIPDLFEIILDELEVSELHGNELGLKKINDIANNLIKIIEDLDALFMFTRVEKKHIISMRLADALLDNENNPAITSIHYNIPFFKKMLAHYIEETMDKDDFKTFWKIHLEGNSQNISEFLRKFRNKIMVFIPDERAKQLLLDAIDWGILNPHTLLTERVSNQNKVKDFRSLQYESPNLVSVTTLLHGLYNISSKSGRKISKIIHDEQDEFGEYIKHSFSYLRKVKVNHSNQFLLPQVHESNLVLKNLELESSQNSPFLQIVDVCLWLVRQKVDKGKNIFGEAQLLLVKIAERL